MNNNRQRPKAALLAGLLLGIVALPPLPGYSQSKANPLTEAELVDLLKNYVPPARVAELARDKGINFSVTPQAERELRDAGADNSLIGALRGLAPRTAPTPLTPPPTSPLLRAEEFLKTSRFSEALPLLQQSASNGNAEAERYLGDLNKNGWGVPQDFVRARQWYEKAAAGGNAIAMNNLGTFYRMGRGVPVNFVLARQWYEKGAEAGNSEAMNNFGVMWRTGRGGPQNWVQARQWFEKAAAAGNANAMNNLGNIYERGLGIPRDHRIATQWFEKAAAAGNAKAQRNLDDAQQ
ncbi:MAG TPA: tetratricopeptide repeat protein [Bryobacteraceae bacterium]|jgi:hypothetical protein|nr:tetratricopeptide repeat protein [Bryobacteraceae bacterium]